MRRLKMLGITSVIAVAAMAYAGTGTASADSACLVDPGPLGMCPFGAVWNGPIIGLTEDALFNVHGTVTKCKSSFLADYNFNEGPHVGVLYLILSLSFTECAGACPGVVAENLPYLLLVQMGLQHAKLTGDGNGAPSFLLQNCLILNQVLNCLYRSQPPVLLNYLLETNSQGAPLAGALRINAPLNWGGDDPLCPPQANFQATYLIYKDLGGIEGAELFFAALP